MKGWGRGVDRSSHIGQPPEVVAYSWAAQCRLHATYRRISARKGSHTAVVAVARELAGFVWGLMTGNTEV